MENDTRRWVALGVMTLIGLFSVLFFFQTRDPMILIFGVIAASVFYFVINRGSMGGGRVVVRVKCTACGQLNLEDAKFCSACGRAI